MTTRAMYPVLYCVEYKSGRVDNKVCEKSWPAVRNGLAKMKASGAIKDFRYTTEIDRRNRCLVATPNGVIPARRAATKQRAKITRPSYRRFK